MDIQRDENAVAKILVDCAFHIHQDMGPGLLESAYAVLFAHLLKKRGLKFEREKGVPVRYEGVTLETGFRIDFLVEALVIVELKSVEELRSVHKKQLLTYLKLANKRLGLLINFGAPTIRDGIKRVVNHLPDG